MNEEQVHFRFEGVQIMHKMVFPLDETKPVPTVFAFEIKVEVRVQPENRFVIMNVMVTIKDKATDITCADYSVWCLFQVLEFEKHVTLESNGQYRIPDLLDQTARPVSISTVRGIIYADLRNTYLNNIIMPIVYMNDFKFPNVPPTLEEAFG